MITYPNAKINLGLNITEKRPDGYHNLETVFYPINLQDALEVKPLEERNIEWNCDCSHERMQQALMTIGRKDMTEIIEEDGQAELQCQFCLNKYNFSKEELTEMLNNM